MFSALQRLVQSISPAFRGQVAAFRIAGLAMLIIGSAASSAQAQTLNQIASQRSDSGKSGKRLTVEAREMVYDNDHNTVAATGDVILYYDGRKLEADRVTYDRNTRHVFAQGNAKLTETDGTVTYGDRFELTDDFKDGFIDSLRVVTKSEERFSAPRAERANGETTVFERGLYTACKPCAEHPERPPLWQVRAARIIHQNSEQTIYYENASLEFFGLPVFYLPLFSGPDPSVNRRSGFLTPNFSNSTPLGFGIRIPYFWAIAPNYDVTFTPTYFSRQGLLGQAEWRHRLETGQYSIKIAGINQLDRSAYLASPSGAGDRDFRGSVETVGKFYINRQWTFGWDISLASDKYFFQNYRVRNVNNSYGYLGVRDATSTVYLGGQSDRSWFDLRGAYFQGLTSNDWQKQLPVVAPLLDYNRRFDAPVVGGEISVTANVTNLHRDAAAFSELNPSLTNPARLFGLYDSCTTFNRNSCLLRGIAGDYARASTELNWRKQYIDQIGEVWTPFVNARFDAAWKNIDNTGFTQGNYGNFQQNNFIDSGDSFVGRALPTVGLNYRFPFVAATGWGTHVIEPIGQIAVSPNESKIGKLPNEDAQSLVFDDSNLFQVNRFSGFDRVEGGTRASVGAQYTGTFEKGAYINALFGQSYHLAGRNSFQQEPGSQDLVNTGSQSGLDKAASDYVGRIIAAPNGSTSLAFHGRFDADTFQAKRIDVVASKSYSFDNPEYLRSISSSVTYTRILPQPLIGYDQRREGISLSGTASFANNWSVNGAVLFDLDKHLYNNALNQLDGGRRTTTIFNTASTSVGLGYSDECTTFAFTYVTSYLDVQSGQRTRSNAFVFRLELKHLGDLNYRSGTDFAGQPVAR